MDDQLQSLIDKIKKEGVASAETSAAQIIAEAEKKAAQIIADAKSQADGIVKEAKAESERLEKSSEDAIKQAGRNLLISFRDGITSELKKIIEAETATAYSKELLEKLIPETVKTWAYKSEVNNLSLLLSEKDLVALEAGLKSALKDEISKGLEIKPDKTLSNGFRIGLKDGSAFYDYSAESVAELFSAYLNPRVAAILKQAASEAK